MITPIKLYSCSNKTTFGNVENNNAPLRPAIDLSYKPLANYLTDVSYFAQYVSRQIKSNELEMDFNDIKNFKLPNNILINFDTCWKNKETLSRGTLLLPQNSDKNIATTKILNEMLNKNASEFSKKIANNDDHEYGLYVGFEVTNNRLNFSTSCDHSRTEESFEKLVQFLLNPDLSEENLQYAKQKVEISQSIYPSDIADKYILSKNQNISSAQTNSVTLEDVKKLYNDFLTSSHGKIGISLPIVEYNKSKDAILSILSQIPSLKQYNKASQTETIKPLNKIMIVKGKSYNSTPEYSKFYTIIDNSSLKEKILSDILRFKFNSVVESSDECKSFHSTTDYLDFTNGRYVKFGLKSKEKQASMDKLKSATDKIINSLINMPLTQDDLDNIKKNASKDYKENFDKQYIRVEMLLNEYSDGNNKLKTYLDMLNSITSEDVQIAAQKYFSQPYIEVIEE